jgi:hypothetical protein
MIWFFGTSHTDGFADGIKHTDKPTFADLVAKKLKMNYINFATSGSDNLQMYKCMKAAIADTTIERPAYIIIEPRIHYSFKDFPKIFNCSDSINLPFHWRNKNDAVYIGFWNEYMHVNKAWNKTFDELKDKSRVSEKTFLKTIKQNLLKYQSPMHGNFVLTLDENNNHIWVEGKSIDNYDNWLGDWYKQYLSFVGETFAVGHDYVYTKLEQEISSLLLLASTVTTNVGYMFWDFNETEEEIFLKRLQHLKHYQIFDSSVHLFLKNNHNKEYNISKTEYIDAHLGPTAHKVLAPYIVNWIKNQSNA